MGAENWVKATEASALPPGQMVGLEVGGKAVCVYNVDGQFYATSNICTHAFTLLSEGYLDGQMIECPLHAGTFDVTTGAGQGPPITCDLEIFPVRLVGDEVQVDIG
jgi:nitrite reductase/ring-hydroxylating ferredoxin subunit